jgi:hypothetical protein
MFKVGEDVYVYLLYIYINGKELKKVNACKNGNDILVISFNGIRRGIKKRR